MSCAGNMYGTVIPYDPYLVYLTAICFFLRRRVRIYSDKLISPKKRWLHQIIQVGLVSSVLLVNYNQFLGSCSC